MRAVVVSLVYARLAALDAGASTTVTFTAPVAEGLCTAASDVPGDTFVARFVVQ